MLRSISLLFVLSIGSGSVSHTFDERHPSVPRADGTKRSAIFKVKHPKIAELDAISQYNVGIGLLADDVLFYLYSKENINNPQQVFLNNIASINKSNFTPSKQTKILVHGWMDNLNANMIQLIKNEFLANLNVNIIAVDWSAVARDILYFPCVIEVPDVGNLVGQFIHFLVAQSSVKASDVHVIGHSLGAHVSGFAGKTVQNYGYNVSRISGLDPAWPGYYLADTESRLAASDADFVDVIHSSSYIAGFPTVVGQADFFPNGGIHPEPGCSILNLVCSHERSIRYYAQSINDSNVFSAQSCQSVSYGRAFDCSQGNSDARMGYPANKQQDKGVFYLTTNDDPPYAKG